MRFSPSNRTCAFTTLRSSRSLSPANSVTSVTISTAGSAKGSRIERMAAGSITGTSPCRLTMMSKRVLIDGIQSLEDAIRARGVIGPRHHRIAAPSAHGLGDLGIAARDNDRTDVRFACPIEHVDDHRLARDISQRLVGKPRRGETRRDDDDGIHRTCHVVEPDRGCAGDYRPQRAERNPIFPFGGLYIRLRRHRRSR